MVVSAPLIEMLRKAQNGGFFKEPISNLTHHIVGYAYVDDTDLIDVDMRDDKRHLDDAAASMQEAIHRWEGGLKATGGAIRPDKSWVYAIGFDFDAQGKWHYKPNVAEEYKFKVRDHKNNLKQMDTMEVHEGKETLGVFLAPDGNNDAMIDYLKSKAEHWNELVHTGHLSRNDARRALSTTIMKSIEYGLNALTLSRNDCKTIMKPILDAGLTNMGVCRNFPRGVAYGPVEEGGLGIPDIYTTQGTGRIATLVENIGSDSLLGELLRTSIEAAKVEIGVGRDLFSLDYPTYSPILTDCWIKHVWEYAHENNITILEETTSNIELQRENDLFLMEEIAESKSFTKAELQHINRCRLHLQVTCLSDITTGNGDQLSDTYSCTKDNNRNKSTTLWPIQPKPGKRSIALWKKALRKCFPRIDGILQHTLQRWTRKDNNWIWYYHPKTQRIFQRYINNTWKIWRRQGRGRIGKRPKYKYENRSLHKPSDSFRATINRQDKSIIILTGWAEEIIIEDSDILPRVEQWATNEAIVTQNEEKVIVNAIKTQQLRIVSDGSYNKDNQTGTAAWIAETIDGTTAISGTLISPGPGDVQGSHRSELTGILGGMTFMEQLCKKYDITNGTIEYGCDGEGAILAANSAYETIQTSRKHFDIIQAIQNIKKRTTITWVFRHVKGHQDDIKEYNDLDRWEQLNVHSDLLAKERMQKLLLHPPHNIDILRPSHLPNEQCSVHWQNHKGQSIKICSHLQKSLRYNIELDRIRAHWKKKGKFNSYTERMIDWDHTHKSHKTTTPGFHQFISKWISGFCGVGVMMKLWKFQAHSKCPRCQMENESTMHILKCPQPSAHSLWKEEMNNLDEWMKQNGAQPELRVCIVENLQSWHDGSPYPSTRYLNPTLQTAIKKQDLLGWTAFIEGFLAKEWKQCQKEYMQGTQRSPDLWMAKLQKKIWQITWTMWEHRNKHLHSDDYPIHQFALSELNTAIITEHTRGLDNLPKKYQRLFKGSIQERYADNIHQKRQWLTSVWAAREQYTNERINNAETESRIFYSRWRRRHLEK